MTICQHWSKLWLCAIRQQIILTNIDQAPWCHYHHHMASQGLNELNVFSQRKIFVSILFNSLGFNWEKVSIVHVEILNTTDDKVHWMTLVCCGPWWMICSPIHYHKIYTVWCHYNAANLLQNPHNRHPIARPWGRDMGCLLWVWNSDLYSASVSTVKYHAILDCVVTALELLLSVGN